jgi:hypothetical protein
MAINTKFAQKSFTGLPTWAKGIIGVAVVGVTIYAIYKIPKILSQFKDDKPNKSEGKEVQNELVALNQNPKTKQTISPSQALSIANTIYNSMIGLGTDEYAIYGQFYILKNNADFLAVQKAFGTRTVPSGTILFVSDFKGTLVSCLRNELDADEAQIINKILGKKKIKFRI